MPEVLSQLLTVAGVGASIYAAIRADLARLNERTTVHALRLDRIEHKVFT